jgi:hypothetical protein
MDTTLEQAYEKHLHYAAAATGFTKPGKLDQEIINVINAYAKATHVSMSIRVAYDSIGVFLDVMYKRYLVPNNTPFYSATYEPLLRRDIAHSFEQAKMHFVSQGNYVGLEMFLCSFGCVHGCIWEMEPITLASLPNWFSRSSVLLLQAEAEYVQGIYTKLRKTTPAFFWVSRDMPCCVNELAVQHSKELTSVLSLQEGDLFAPKFANFDELCVAVGKCIKSAPAYAIPIDVHTIQVVVRVVKQYVSEWRDAHGAFFHTSSIPLLWFAYMAMVATCSYSGMDQLWEEASLDIAHDLNLDTSTNAPLPIVDLTKMSNVNTVGHVLYAFLLVRV